MFVTGENVLRSLKSFSNFRLPQDQRAHGIQPADSLPGPAAAVDDGLEPGSKVDPSFPSLPRSLGELSEQSGTIPANSVIIGLCEDGMPLTIDLTNPSPGSILILGDSQSGKTRLLRTMLASLDLTFETGNIGFNLITRNPGDYLALTGHKDCLEYLTPNHHTMLDLIENLSHQVEERRRNQPGKSRLILAIDDLASCLQWMDEENYLRLASIARHGPRYGVWTFAVQDAENFNQVDSHLLSAFRTHFFTHIRRDRSIRAHYGLGQIPAREIGEQACTPFGTDWLRFWILNDN